MVTSPSTIAGRTVPKVVILFLFQLRFEFYRSQTTAYSRWMGWYCHIITWCYIRRRNGIERKRVYLVVGLTFIGSGWIVNRSSPLSLSLFIYAIQLHTLKTRIVVYFPESKQLRRLIIPWFLKDGRIASFLSSLYNSPNGMIQWYI